MTALGRASVVRADARALPLPDASLDLLVTSPPYWALRSYTDGGEHYEGQIGSEATPGEYLANLWDCTREWMRVLKLSGSMWINLGDVYGRGSRSREARAQSLHDRRARGVDRGLLGDDLPAGTPPKSLVGLPWRYALGCIDDLGLILRRDLIWHKTNPLPESVTDRCATTHEYWFHLVKQQRYFAALDEIREPHTGGTHPRRADGGLSPKEQATINAGHRRGFFPAHTFNLLGKLPGSVWSIPSQPLTVPAELEAEHFAAYPTELPLRIIAGWSPSGICTECGEGRRPVVEKPGVFGHNNNPDGRTRSTIKGGSAEWAQRMRNPDRITGYACACPEPSAPTRPSLVADPFGGTGTTSLAARALGRDAISFDLSHDYARLAQWRTADPGELARVLHKPKPPKPIDGQLGFDLEAS